MGKIAFIVIYKRQLLCSSESEIFVKVPALIKRFHCRITGRSLSLKAIQFAGSRDLQKDLHCMIRIVGSGYC